MWLSCVYLKDVCMNNICTCLDSIYLCIDTNQNNFFSRCVLFNIISLISFLNMYHLWVYNSFAQTPIHIYYIDFLSLKSCFFYIYCTNSNTFFLSPANLVLARWYSILILLYCEIIGYSYIFPFLFTGEIMWFWIRSHYWWKRLS